MGQVYQNLVCFAVMVFNLFFVTRGRAWSKRSRKKPPKVYLENKEKARSLVIARLEYFNQYYGFKWNRVSIKNTKRRWGSCSKKGNLNFCYKVALIDMELADYIIVHELCHLGQFNHSKEFWKLVSRSILDYKAARDRLTKLGFSQINNYPVKVKEV